MLLIRALPLFGILGFSYGSTRGLLKMPTFPEKCIYSGTDCWSLMLKPDLEGCPQNVNGMVTSKFFFGTSKNLCNNEVLFGVKYKGIPAY
jgi:hypothetical protein